MAQSSPRGEGAGGVHYVDVEDDLATVAYAAPGEGTKDRAADLPVCDMEGSGKLSEHLMGCATASTHQLPSNEDRA
jgi:hypothetical protein